MSWAQIVGQINTQPAASANWKLTHKVCKGCDKMLSLNSFYKHEKAYRSRCKICYKQHLTDLQHKKLSKSAEKRANI